MRKATLNWSLTKPDRYPDKSIILSRARQVREPLCPLNFSIMTFFFFNFRVSAGR